nr:hypothetical protein [uncultured Draconibacterium sp.]
MSNFLADDFDAVLKFVRLEKQKIIFYVALLLVIFSVDSIAAIDDSNSKLPDFVTEIKHFSSNKDLSIDSVINLSDNSFRISHQRDIQLN